MDNLVMFKRGFEEPLQTQLSDNPMEWEKEVYQEFFNKLPEEERPTKFDIVAEDASIGALFGWLVIINNPEKERQKFDPYKKLQANEEYDQTDDNVYFPVIIRDFKLSPMDIFIFQGTFYPVSVDNINMTRGAAIQGAGLNGDQTGMMSGHAWQNQNSPSIMTQKGFLPKTAAFGSMLDRIAKTVDPKFYASVLKKLAQDDEVRTSIDQNEPILDKLEELVDEPGEKPAEYSNTLVQTKHPYEAMTEPKGGLVEKSAAKARSYDSNERNVKEADPVRLYVSGGEIKKLVDGLEKERGIFTDTYDDYRYFGENKLSDADEVADVLDKPITIKDQGNYNVRIEQGSAMKGFCIPKVIDLQQNLLGQKLFVTLSATHDGRRWALQESMAGIPATVFSTDLQGDVPVAGDTGVLLGQQPKNDVLVATVPFTITKTMRVPRSFCCQPVSADESFPNPTLTDALIIKLEGDKEAVLLPVDGNGSFENIMHARDVDGMEIFGDRELYFVPTQYFRFYKLGARVQLESNPDMLQKQANLLHYAGKQLGCLQYDGSHWQHRDTLLPASSTQRHSFVNMNKTAALFLLAKNGVSLKSGTHLLKRAQASKQVYFVLPQRQEKKASKALTIPTKDAQATVNTLHGILATSSLFKTAAKIHFAMKQGPSKTIRQLTNVLPFSKIAAMDMYNPANQYVLDSVLSLGFLTRDNLVKFVAALPLFQKVLSFLAEMLLLARLGEYSLPEREISDALRDMSKVINGLQLLQRKIV